MHKAKPMKRVCRYTLQKIMHDFQFTAEEFIEVQEIWRDINSQCRVLQERTGCPNSEIIKMIDSVKSFWENKV